MGRKFGRKNALKRLLVSEKRIRIEHALIGAFGNFLVLFFKGQQKLKNGSNEIKQKKNGDVF